VTVRGDETDEGAEQLRATSETSVVRHGQEANHGGVSSPFASSPQPTQQFRALVRPGSVLDERANLPALGNQDVTISPADPGIVPENQAYDTPYAQIPPFQGSSYVGDPFHRPSTAVPFLRNPFDLGPLTEPYVLVPHVVVTPQRKAVDDTTSSV